MPAPGRGAGGPAGGRRWRPTRPRRPNRRRAAGRRPAAGRRGRRQAYREPYGSGGRLHQSGGELVADERVGAFGLQRPGRCHRHGRDAHAAAHIPLVHDVLPRGSPACSTSGPATGPPTSGPCAPATSYWPPVSCPSFPPVRRSASACGTAATCCPPRRHSPRWGRLRGGSWWSGPGRAPPRRWTICTAPSPGPRCARCSPATATARPTTARSPTGSSIPPPWTTSSGPPPRSRTRYSATTATPTTPWSTPS